jgi:hypothetical protein
MSDVIDEHRLYLSDIPRLEAYRAALDVVVSDGDIVVDLGAGSGILGLLACRAGAGKVYAMEHTSLIDLTRQIAAENGQAERIVHIKNVSTRATLPERADVICCDQIGRFGFEAGVFGYFADALKRFAKPDARFVPSHIEFFVAPVAVPERAVDVAFWERPVMGFQFQSAKEIARNSGYPCRLQPSHMLGGAQQLARRPTSSDESFSGRVQLIVERPGVLDGLGAHFRAQLADGVFVTNCPTADDRIDRRNVLLPIGASVQVEEGDRVDVRMHFIPRETLLSWNVRVTRSDGSVVAESRHSTFKGMFLGKEDIQRTAPDSTPRLTPWGHARRSVLELCDGVRPLHEIERELAVRHPELLPSPRDVSCFVASVVSRYTT